MSSAKTQLTRQLDEQDMRSDLARRAALLDDQQILAIGAEAKKMIGRTHEVKGQAISAFVTLKESAATSENLKEELRQHVAKKIGAIAAPKKPAW